MTTQTEEEIYAENYGAILLQKGYTVSTVAVALIDEGEGHENF